ncbi:hypothetical protein CLIB1444_07S02542 [[Candida] jaroonii]|uniref:Uncharacterized protein n=1 Tax=[Candida] jaroonii TaxID=467808 RepID=A0ACA9Y9Q5_9ASCO|nr:hypothetical protein CLIB1444_07S02542 [[Candida] jaroonii]
MKDYQRLDGDVELSDMENNIGHNPTFGKIPTHSSKFGNFLNHNLRQLGDIRTQDLKDQFRSITRKAKSITIVLLWFFLYFMIAILVFSLASFVGIGIWIGFILAVRVVVIASNGFFGILDRDKAADYLAHLLDFVKQLP